MSDVIDSVENEIPNLRLRRLVQRLEEPVRIAVARVGAHFQAPSSVALPRTGLEGALSMGFDRLPADRKRRAAERSLAMLASERSVNLRSPLEVTELMRERLEHRDLGLTTADFAGPMTPNFRPLQTAPSKLELRIHKVKCVDETNLEWPGSDEIDLGGLTVSADGTTTKVGKFRVSSDFDDGESKTYNPPRVMTTFDPRAGTAWPKTYFATFLMSEKDHGEFPTFLTSAYNELKKYVSGALQAAAAFVGVSGPVVTAAIQRAVDWLFSKLLGWIKDWWEDDIFPPKTVSVTLDSPASRWAGGATDSPERVVRFQGHGGIYDVTYDWRLA